MKNFLSAVGARLKRPRYYIPTILIILIIGGGLVWSLKGGDQGFETEKVKRQTVSQTISETGTVEPVHDVDLSFERSGRVRAVNVREGDKVQAGELLVALDGGTAYADYLSAEARLRAEEARLAELTTTASGQTIAEADLKAAERSLENARRNLISGGLEAYLVKGGASDPNRSFEQPEISGTYDSIEEGEYRLEFYASGASSGYSFRYSGLESGIGTVSSIQPEPLGRRGLYIQFPENFGAGNSEWVVPIPNKRGSSYITYLNAFEAAQENYEAAKIGFAQASGPNLRAAQAAVDERKAALQAARAILAETSLIAPFSGVITSVEVDPGELASPGAPALSLISDEDFQITLNVPEADIANLKVGAEAVVTFDAYDDTEFTAKVASIAPSATVEDGVPSFETVLYFIEPDERIRSGLSADVEIIAIKKENVVVIPSRAIFERDSKNLVRVVDTEGKLAERTVVTGLRGSDGLSEIVSGLKEGDTVVTFIGEAKLKELEVEALKAEKNATEDN